MNLSNFTGVNAISSREGGMGEEDAGTKGGAQRAPPPPQFQHPLSPVSRTPFKIKEGDRQLYSRKSLPTPAPSISEPLPLLHEETKKISS